MPATVDELIGWVRSLLAGEIMPDTVPLWADGSAATPAEEQEMRGLLIYEAHRRGSIRRWGPGPAHRRALALLKQFLTPLQRQQLRQRGTFDVRTPTGRHFRFRPAHGQVGERVRHGRYTYEVRTFCLHPENAAELPNPDVTLAQLLVLLADEAEFLREAHATERRSDLWNGEWRRQLNARHRAERG